MKFKIIFYSISLLMLFVACREEEETIPETSGSSRTVLVYMIAQNSLSEIALTDIEEMKEGMRQVNASFNNLLVYVDDKSAAPQLIRLGKDKRGNIVEEIVQRYPEQTSTNVDVMKGVISTAFNKYKADSYGMAFWSHAEGWIPTSLKTRWFGQDGSDKMNISDLHDALQVAPDLDFLLFDACYMGSVEVAYALRDCGNYLIGSPVEIPGPGAFYETVVPAMFSEQDAAIKIASSYFDYYNNLYNGGKNLSDDNWTAGVSLGVVKLSELDELAAATAQLLPKYVTGKQDFDLSDEMFYDQRTYTRYYYDLDRFIYQITAGNSDYDTWREVFDRVMVYWKFTPKNYSQVNGMFSIDKDAKGLSTYVPRMSNPSLNTSYQQTEWYQTSGWADTGW